jgi:hypothetical protein
MKSALFSILALLTASSSGFAQFTWENWSYPGGATATAGVGSGLVTLKLTGMNSFALFMVDTPVQYQSNFPYTQTYGDSAGAMNAGSKAFQMELDFTGFSSTAGLILAVGQLAHVTGTSGYTMSAFNSSNNPIPLNTFGQIGNFDFGIPLNGNFFFNDDLSLNTTNGNFSVATVAGQDDVNSDMLIFSLPAGVDKIFIKLQTPANPPGDTINVMVSGAVPEPGSISLIVIAGLMAVLSSFRRRLGIRRSPNV